MVRSTHARHDTSTVLGNEPRTWEQPRDWHVGAYAVLATLALIALAFEVRINPNLPIDVAATQVVQSVHAGWFDVLMRAVGEPGYPPQVIALVLVILAALYFTGLKWEAVAEMFAMSAIGAIGLLIKVLVDRPRPSPDLFHVLNVLDKGRQSFPAGHVESYVAILGFLWFLAFTQARITWVRSLSLFVFGEMITVIGISRIYTGEHWLTDVVGGYLLGSAWLIVTIWLYNWGRGRFFVRGRADNKRD